MPLHYLKITLVLLALTSTFCVDAVVKRNIKLSVTPQNNIIYVDSIDYRKTITRVYARLSGKANTSMKIEEITGATDIDGIDFKRWFQFEESGIVAIQIDFVKSSPNKNLKFDIISSKGTIKCIVNSSK